MSLRFEQPLWLWLLVLIAPAAWIGLRWLVSMSRLRRASAVLTRAALITLLAMMLGGATLVRQTDRLATIAVVDVSGSVRRFAHVGTDSAGVRIEPLRAVHEYLQTASARRGPDDLLGIVVFDGRSMAVALPTRGDVLDRPIDVRLSEGTDIADAIRFASALVPPDALGRLVLVSDGNQTRGDALKAAGELAARGGASPIPIDVVPLAYHVRQETMIESVDAPPRAPAESTVTVRVVLNSTDGARGTLRLLRDDEPIDINGPAPGLGRTLDLAPGRHVELIDVRLGPSKIHRFKAVFEPDRTGGAIAGDTNAQNNQAEAFTITPGRGRVLVLDGVSAGDATGPGAILARTLERSGIRTTLLPPDALPRDLLSMQDYDLVILENVPAEAIDRSTQETLSRFVRDLGGGLVMVGGPNSFGAGGWKGSPIEPILPVSLDLPDRLVVPEAAIMIVLDSSGSMGRSVMGSLRTQQEIANEAAALAVMTLDTKDLVGVVEFNSRPRVVVPLGPNASAEQTAERIRSIAPGGGTNLRPALQIAMEQLEAVDAKIKHVIVLSDGVSVGADALPAMAARMKDRGINVSTIAVGDAADSKTMDRIALEGGGAYYEVVSPEMLPRVFIRAIRIVRSPMIRLGMFQPVLLATGSPLVAGLDQPPDLGGVNLTQARDDPTVVSGMMTPEGEPLLASWAVELGRVVAFTSDAHDWARRWLDWPGYQRLWTQIARLTSRSGDQGDYDLRTQVVGDELRIEFEAWDKQGRPLEALSVPLSLHTPGGKRIDLRLSQTGPGLYTGSVPADQSGNYIAVLKPMLGARRLPPAIGGASVASGAEYRRLRSNVALLEQLAQATGGRVLDLNDPERADLFARDRIEPTEARTPIWDVLLVWTLAVLLLDVGTRRVAWDRFLGREFGPGLQRAAAEAIQDRSERAARALEALRRRDRSQPDPILGPPALGSADARRIAIEQAQRRRQARLERLRALRQSVATGATDPQTPGDSGEPKVGDQTPGDVDDPGTGLLAAKRRVQRRFERTDD